MEHWDEPWPTDDCCAPRPIWDLPRTNYSPMLHAQCELCVKFLWDKTQRLPSQGCNMDCMGVTRVARLPQQQQLLPWLQAADHLLEDKVACMCSHCWSLQRWNSSQ